MSTMKSLLMRKIRVELPTRIFCLINTIKEKVVVDMFNKLKRLVTRSTRSTVSNEIIDSRFTIHSSTIERFVKKSLPDVDISSVKVSITQKPYTSKLLDTQVYLFINHTPDQLDTKEYGDISIINYIPDAKMITTLKPYIHDCYNGDVSFTIGRALSTQYVFIELSLFKVLAEYINDTLDIAYDVKKHSLVIEEYKMEGLHDITFAIRVVDKKKVGGKKYASV